MYFKKVFNMIHSICGLQNEGKSLIAVKYAYEDYKKGRKIITNVDILNFPHYKVNKDFVFWIAENQPTFNNISFFFDELWLWLDSYQTMENRVATYFFLQSSKSNANIFLTAQDNSQNLIRIRRNLHRYTECKRFLLTKKGFKRVIAENRDLDNYNPFVYIEESTYQRDLNMDESVFKLKSKKMIHAQKYFNLYSTYEKRIII